jgi:ABC-type Zn2+ transport system substrate-binding protein/surface adhesin
MLVTSVGEQSRYNSDEDDSDEEYDDDIDYHNDDKEDDDGNDVEDHNDGDTFGYIFLSNCCYLESSSSLPSSSP